jgi:tetratricopeptide (TPR) repeat protein
VGYRLKAQALSGQKLFRESVAWYRRALERLDSPGQLGVSRELGLVYKELGQYETAYRLLRDSMNAFDPMTSYRDLYDFGQAAFEAGRTREAALIFRLGEKKVPPDDREWEEKYRHALLRSNGGRAIQ